MTLACMCCRKLNRRRLTSQDAIMVVQAGDGIGVDEDGLHEGSETRSPSACLTGRKAN